MSTRLNKLLADRGIGARRKCDLLIQEGHVRVNGHIVTEPGTQIEEQRDRGRGQRPRASGQAAAGLLGAQQAGRRDHHARGPRGRPTVAMYLPKGARLFPVHHQLDADTSGLLMLTNDGELAHKLMHPRYGVQKFYRVRLDREPTRGQLERIARGVEIEPGFVTAPARARHIDPGFEAIMIEVVVHEGRFRQVRRMCEKVGMRVTGLHRVGYGPVRLGPLPRGMYGEYARTRSIACAAPARVRSIATAARLARAAPPRRPASVPWRPRSRSRRSRPRTRGRSSRKRGSRAAVLPPRIASPTSEWTRPTAPTEGVSPARCAGGHSGDAASSAGAQGPARPGKPERAPAPRRDEGGPLPWHGAEYRRGAAPKPGSKAARSAPVGKLGRRAEAP